jgi:peptidoglycan/xylan/chitin deacetylase (PgdA/CDA1 family)
MYHEPAADLLDRHLAYLARHYVFITLDDVVEALRSDRWNELPLPGVVVTIDDGKRSNYTLLPLFRRYNLTPTLFLCSQMIGTHRRFWFDILPEREPFLKRMKHEQRIGRLEEVDEFELAKEFPDGDRAALSLSEIADMADSIDIQSHTRFHPVLTTCNYQDCLTEIACSRSELESLVGRPVSHFCFPHGDYNDREVRIVQESGYRSARTVNTGWTGPRSDPYQLEVLGVDDRASINQLAADMAGQRFLESLILRMRQQVLKR